jgi:hypothetical protein
MSTVATDRHRAVGLALVHREVAIDAAADGVALGLDADRFGDPQRAVFQRVEATSKRRIASSAAAAPGRAASRTRTSRRRSIAWNATSGTARWEGSTISKYLALPKPKRPATRFDGNCCTAVFCSRAAPL